MKVQDCKRSSLLPRFGRLVAVGMMAVALLSPIGAQAAEMSLFYEDFESNDLVQWSDVQYWNVVGVGGGSDGKKARGVGNEGRYSELIARKSTLGYQNIRLAFRYRVSGFEGGDLAYVVALKGPAYAWETFATFSENSEGWQSLTIDLPADYGDQASFRFGFMMEANAADDNFDVDSIRLYAMDGEEVISEEPEPELPINPEEGDQPTDETAVETPEEEGDQSTTSGDTSPDDGQQSQQSGTQLASVPSQSGNSQAAPAQVLAAADSAQEVALGSYLPNTGGSGLVGWGSLLVVAGLVSAGWRWYAWLGRGLRV